MPKFSFCLPEGFLIPTFQPEISPADGTTKVTIQVEVFTR